MDNLEDEIRLLRKELAWHRDIREITRLKHDYCRFNDGGWPAHGPSHMGPCADLFVQDGVWDGRPVAPRSEGRENIRAMLEAYRGLSPFVVHDVLNGDIDIHGDSATGYWHAIIFSTADTGESQMVIGTYDEEYVRTEEGWRFKSLKFTLARSVTVEYKDAD